MNISFILVEPAVPENVGAAARAIKTMGFSDFRLVNPCDYLSVDARKLAHGSNDILENAQVFNNLEEALYDIDFAFATSARDRWVKLDIIDSHQLTQFINDKGDTISNIAIVFGREESGLTNQEINLCQRVTTVPLKTKYPSLNLAQSVMVYAYILSELNESETKSTNSTNEQSFKALVNKVNKIMNEIELGAKTLIHGRVMERLSELSEKDIKLLHSVTAELIKKLSK
ncbi:tRNA/rRNA methyltransferase [Tenuifilum thalassicum]|uniref:tRNA (cytidine/uridine-2'-O-)-methyltransferase TrmJ n=1 Tax=Tenuifilum thalassicum TaxID=2590900 RepID=A0A7D3Y523_9BACT|nr:tRNA/rRNA methyltransferase [Tenuifilum thalassicum]QKG80329.1 tRNA/rRNA methyltransferase [Tenuifilum thalassicum]